MRQEWTSDELVDLWTLVGDDWRWVGNKTGVPRLGFAVLLKFFEAEARFPEHSEEVPSAAVEYVASQVRVEEVARRWGTLDLLNVLKEADCLTEFTGEFTSVASREIIDRATLRRRSAGPRGGDRAGHRTGDLLGRGAHHRARVGAGVVAALGRGAVCLVHGAHIADGDATHAADHSAACPSPRSRRCVPRWRPRLTSGRSPTRMSAGSISPHRPAASWIGRIAGRPRAGGTRLRCGSTPWRCPRWPSGCGGSSPRPRIACRSGPSPPASGAPTIR
ncbi:hypothetical protein CDG81_10475 [Actinopolyspora erythraea]|uniref:DUF4158 domain-containing protein n=1 Tax=Actinopolyspora erythraea TaxID=414996 RepID=A0A223RRZ1_9ACTN|nr:hypothetical protein CDG81_10475 [Actinopolyspora erythraea]